MWPFLTVQPTRILITLKCTCPACSNTVRIGNHSQKSTRSCLPGLLSCIVCVTGRTSPPVFHALARSEGDCTCQPPNMNLSRFSKFIMLPPKCKNAASYISVPYGIAGARSRTGIPTRGVFLYKLLPTMPIIPYFQHPFNHFFLRRWFCVTFFVVFIVFVRVRQFWFPVDHVWLAPNIDLSHMEERCVTG